MTNKPHYVYALFRENEIPFYIGMGKGRRISSHEGEANCNKNNRYKNNVINKLKREGKQVLKMKLVEDLTREEAFNIERDLIQLIGRHPGGPLTNLTSGGDGSRDMSADARARVGAASRGNKRSLGSKRTMEVRLKLAEIARKRVHSLETRAKRAAHAIGRKWSDESRLKASVARAKWHAEHPERGAVLAEANRHWTPEMKAAAAANRKPVYTEKGRASISAHSKGNTYSKGAIRTPEHRAAVAASNRARAERRQPYFLDPHLFWYSSHVEHSPALAEAIGLRQGHNPWAPFF